MPEKDFRSFVYGVGGREGEWGLQASEWTYAHEAGHLMGLPDDYEDTIRPDGTLYSKPKDKHKNHMMAEHGGDVQQHEIDSIIKNTPCPCNEKN